MVATWKQKPQSKVFKRNKLEDGVRGVVGLGEKAFLKRNPEWRSARTPLEGIARTERRAPAVRAILKQTPSLVRGLSLGLWKWEWDWTVQPCWKYSRSTFFFPPWMFQMPQIGPGVCWKEKKSSSFFTEVVCKQHFLLLLRCKYLYQPGESPWACHSIVWKTWGLPLITQWFQPSAQSTSTGSHNQTRRNWQIWDCKKRAVGKTFHTFCADRL